MKLIVRIKGGIGNQLFGYAAARRLALQNDAELVVDDITGFKRDLVYRRKFALDHFRITQRRATASERLEPFERITRGIFKKIEQCKPFLKRRYIQQEFPNFDRRLLDVNIHTTTYIDGLWQSELYFIDVENQIRDDLTIIPPTDMRNIELAELLENKNSVAVHVRWFESGNNDSSSNVGSDYYSQAIRLMDKALDSPFYVVFSDNSAITKQRINFPSDKVIFVSHNAGDQMAFADLWLMTKCKHFILANSTFGWWGAWLGGNFSKRTIVFPRIRNGINAGWAWDYTGQMPNSWIPIAI